MTILVILFLVVSQFLQLTALAMVMVPRTSELYARLHPIGKYAGFPYMVAINLYSAAHASHWWSHSLFVLFAIWWTWIWWQHRKPPDDRWKKRRKKALAKIKQVGGKLVVVPIPQPAPIPI